MILVAQEHAASEITAKIEAAVLCIPSSFFDAGLLAHARCMARNAKGYFC
jgi:hypothetical protein